MSKKQDKIIAQQRIDYMYTKATEFKFNVKDMNQQRQFRLSKPNCTTLDYYPKGNKVFFLDEESWGKVDNLVNFLSFQFNRNSRLYNKDKF